MRAVMWISGIVFILLGFALLLGGARLAQLGGSWYYVLAGLGFIVTGALLILRRREALWVYAVVVLGTLIWAVYEIRFDWWRLAPRGDVIFILGAYLLMPWIIRGLADRPGERSSSVWRSAGWPLAGSLAIAAVVGLIAIFSNPHDRLGSLPAPSSQPAQPATPAQPQPAAAAPDGDWRVYGRTNAGDRYSPLADLTPQNVRNLQVAWTFHTGDIRGPDDPEETTYEVTPLKVGDTLYLCTPHNHVIALDAETGKARWRHDPKLIQSKNMQHLTCRGVAYHEDTAATECQRRIFMGTGDARLISLDAETGQPCPSFGQDGVVNLWDGMPRVQPGFYFPTSPPVIAQNLVIIGGAVSDNVSVDEPSGVIRAYDAATGRLVWNWDSGNPDQTEPIQAGMSYTASSPNSWAVSSADEALGMVYIPMGNQPPDQWGGRRDPEGERFSSSIVALDIPTGRVRWVYQTVHHDLWDMDIGAQPTLVDIDTPQGRVPALLAPTKGGGIFVLDRRNGQPIAPVEERPVPQGAVEGDHTAPTQPFSSLTFLPDRPLEERDMWGATMFDQLLCRIHFRSLRYEGIFTPPSTQGSLSYPGNFGIFDWGGVAVDPIRQVAFANPSYMAFTTRLIPREQVGEEGERPSPTEPAGGSDIEGSAESGGVNPNWGAPFAVELKAFLSPLGLPCQAPPWGAVAGIDLKTQKIVWWRKNGTIRDSSPVPLPFKMGVPSLGGPIITAGGLAFLTSTLDYYIRAYDLTTGEKLWEDRLPAGAQATPISYRSEASGRQFVLAVAGGHGSLGTKAGDAIIAYALPAQ